MTEKGDSIKKREKLVSGKEKAISKREGKLVDLDEYKASLDKRAREIEAGSKELKELRAVLDTSETALENERGKVGSLREDLRGKIESFGKKEEQIYKDNNSKVDELDNYKIELDKRAADLEEKGEEMEKRSKDIVENQQESEEIGSLRSSLAEKEERIKKLTCAVEALKQRAEGKEQEAHSPSEKDDRTTSRAVEKPVENNAKRGPRRKRTIKRTVKEENAEIYSCPHCSRKITNEQLDSGKCPFCEGVFRVESEEITLQIFQCPKCGRNLTEEVAAKGKCPYCSIEFSMI